jgi:hypothetical protein
MITCPSTPEWKRPDDLDLNGEAKQDDDDDNGDLAPPHVCISFSNIYTEFFILLLCHYCNLVTMNLQVILSLKIIACDVGNELFIWFLLVDT